MYVRRSQVYRKLRSRKLAEGYYIVERETDSAGYFVFRRAEGDWAAVGRDRLEVKTGFRKKDDLMEVLAAAS